MTNISNSTISEKLKFNDVQDLILSKDVCKIIYESTSASMVNVKVHGYKEG